MSEITYPEKIFLNKTNIRSLVLFGTILFFFIAFNACAPRQFSKQDRLFERYGRLIKDPDGLFDLPKGFSYEIISQKGDVMSDGLLTPDKPDGMAAFAGKDGG